MTEVVITKLPAPATTKAALPPTSVTSRVPPLVQMGAPGARTELRLNDSDIVEWRWEGQTDWTTLFDLNEIPNDFQEEIDALDTRVTSLEGNPPEVTQLELDAEISARAAADTALGVRLDTVEASLTLPTQRILGRATAGTGAVEALTITQVLALAGITLDTGTITLPGALRFGTDNTYDIGASGANRPRNLHVATGVRIGAQPGTSRALSIGDITADANHGIQVSNATGSWFLDGRATGNSGDFWISTGGNPTLTVARAGGIQIDSNVFLYGDAANTLAQRNGTNAQTFRLYKSYTDANNYERLSLSFGASYALIAFEAAGTGVPWDLQITSAGSVYFDTALSGTFNMRAAGTTRWQVNSSGHFLAGTDNAYDIGANEANRPRSLYLSSIGYAYQFRANDLYCTGGFIAMSTSSGAAEDITLYRDAADTLALRRSTNAQTFRLYNTYTDASNYEVGYLAWNSNVLELGVGNAGTGSVRNISIARTGGNVGIGTASPNSKLHIEASNTNTNTAFGGDTGIRLRNTSVTSGNYTSIQNFNAGQNAVNAGIFFKNVDQLHAGQIDFVTRSLAGEYGVRWTVGHTGHLLAGTDNAYDIGADGATRPRDLHLGRQLVMSSGTITADKPLFDLSQTWNNSGITFTGLKLNVTNTASAQGSALIDLNLGGVSQFKIVNETSINGTANVFGLYTPLINVRHFYGSALIMNGASANNGLKIGINSSLYYDLSNTSFGMYQSAGTVFQIVEASNVLALRNSTSAQTFRLYGTYTDTSNYERLTWAYDSANGRYKISAEAAGTGSDRSLYLNGGSGGGTLLLSSDGSITLGRQGVANRWTISGGGHFLAETDNAYDIGASGATRPRDLHLGRQLVMAAGTITASKPLLDLSQTWNDSGVTFTGLKLNVTNTASAAASLLMDLQVGGTSRVSIDRNGKLIGSTDANTFGVTTLQLGNIRVGEIFAVTSANGICMLFNGASTSKGLVLASNMPITWSATGADLQPSAALFQTTNAAIFCEAANTLALRNSTNAQTFRLYNTYTDASNYERGFMRWASNVFEIGTEAAGTGTQRILALRGPWGTAVDLMSGTSIAVRVGQDVTGIAKALGIGTAGNAPDVFWYRRAAGIAAVTGNSGGTTGAAVEMIEQTAPSAPAANAVRIYAEDDGSGKTRLMALFATGAAQQIAIEP